MGDKAIAWVVDLGDLPSAAKHEAGYLLRRLQMGELLSLPHSRPMRQVGRRCHELRIPAGNTTWRVIYRIDPDAIVIAEVFAKKTQGTPEQVIDTARKRLMRYDAEG